LPDLAEDDNWQFCRVSDTDCTPYTVFMADVIKKGTQVTPEQASAAKKSRSVELMGAD